MIIGFDGNEANVERRVGISEYAYELLREFTRIAPKNTRLMVYLKSDPLPDMPILKSSWEYKKVGPGILWTQLGLPFKLFFETQKPSVFFSPTHYAPRFSPCPVAISIMDLSFIHFPELFAKKDLYQLTNWTKYSVLRAKVIFTISNASKNDIIKHYGISADKVVVTYPGIKEIVALSPQLYPKNMLQNKFGIKKPYFLFVGTLQPRKNIVRLIEAFASLYKDEKKDIELVIVGKKGWLYDEILASPKENGVEDQVRFLEFVSDTELPNLYKNALAYVLPSLYEGFGLPVLEAMKYDCPVITSNVSSLPEAGGDAALYVDPENVVEIAKQMKKLLNNDRLRDELIEKGRKQVKKFSWEKTATETLKVLDSIVKK